MNTKHARKILWAILLFVFAALIQACTAGRVEYIELVPQNSIQQGDDLRAYVTGTGKCSAFRIKWGDGSFSDVNDTDWGTHHTAITRSHAYGYWGGPKTVTAEGLTNCVGQVQARIVVEPQVYRLAFCATNQDCSGLSQVGQMTSSTCGTLSSLPAIRQNAIVTITTGPTQMDFGCAAGGCVYGPDGEPNSVAPSGYPFPGLRKYSLVIRLGSQEIQGSNSFTFTANQSAFMEVCANDNDGANNTGAWGVFIQVDESGS